MKVAIIEPVGGHGGMDYYDYGLAYGLFLNDIEVFYYTCDETFIRFESFIHTKSFFKKAWQGTKIQKLIAHIRGYNKVWVDCKKNKINIIHFHYFDFSFLSLIVLYISKILGFKIVGTIHDVDSFVGRNHPKLDNRCIGLLDGVIVHNKASYNEFQEKIKRRNIIIIPHGNYCYFVNKLPRREIDGRINLLFFGQIKEVKGLDILLKGFSIAVKKRPNLRLIIAGRPWKTSSDKYLNLIKDLNIDKFVTTHFSYIPDEEVEKYYRDSDLVVLPYRRIYQSGVVLLSMSYGRACLTSDLLPFKEIIQQGINGYMFKSESIDDLAECLINLDINKMEDVEKRAFNCVSKDYDWKIVGERTSSFYRNILLK